jgi:hypothetical protein
MGADDEFFAAAERYQRERILRGASPIDTERLQSVIDKIRAAERRGIEDLRETITLDEFKVLLDASAEWQRLMMPNVDPGKDASQ